MISERVSLIMEESVFKVWHCGTKPYSKPIFKLY